MVCIFYWGDKVGGAGVQEVKVVISSCIMSPILMGFHALFDQEKEPAFF